MAKQTKIIGFVMLFLLVAGGVVALVSRPSAPPMTPALAKDLLAEAGNRLKSGDVGGLSDYVHEESSILGYDQGEWRTIFTKMCKQHSANPLDLEWSNVEASGVGNAATISADVRAIQRLPEADVTHFRTHVTIQLQKVSASGFLGMIHGNAWRVAGGNCNPPLPPIDVPSQDSI
jgi:hypothetical protein